MVPIPIALDQPIRTFTLGDQAMVRAFLDRDTFFSCEYNFANLYCWQALYRYSWSLYQDRLLVYDGVSRCMFQPLGDPLPPKMLHGMAWNLADMGFEPRIGGVFEPYLSAYPETEQYFQISQERDHAEYIYRTRHLLALSGTRLHKKRNLISQFKRKFPRFRVRAITPGDLGPLLDFAKGLLNARPEIPKDLEDEFAAMKIAFAHFKPLGLGGIVVEVGQTPAAFSVFNRLTRDTYDILFEKSDITFKGAAQVINQETARYLLDRCRYLNREQDLGVAGLRQAKLSYEPEHVMIPHTLSLLPHA